MRTSTLHRVPSTDTTETNGEEPTWYPEKQLHLRERTARNQKAQTRREWIEARGGSIRGGPISETEWEKYQREYGAERRDLSEAARKTRVTPTIKKEEWTQWLEAHLSLDCELETEAHTNLPPPGKYAIPEIAGEPIIPGLTIDEEEGPPGANRNFTEKDQPENQSSMEQR